MAGLVGPVPVVGSSTSVHDSAKNPLGTRVFDAAGNEYIYLKGVADTIAGSVVTYNDAHATALIAANAIGKVAVAQAAVVANKYGFYMISGSCLVDTVASSAAGAPLGRETTNGKVGDGRAAGDQIYNFIGVTATTDAALARATFHYPFVDDGNGS